MKAAPHHLSWLCFCILFKIKTICGVWVLAFNVVFNGFYECWNWSGLPSKRQISFLSIKERDCCWTINAVMSFCFFMMLSMLICSPLLGAGNVVGIVTCASIVNVFHWTVTGIVGRDWIWVMSPSAVAIICVFFSRCFFSWVHTIWHSWYVATHTRSTWGSKNLNFGHCSSFPSSSSYSFFLLSCCSFFLSCSSSSLNCSSCAYLACLYFSICCFTIRAAISASALMHADEVVENLEHEECDLWLLLVIFVTLYFILHVRYCFILLGRDGRWNIRVWYIFL